MASLNALFVIVELLSGVSAWGPDGHTIVAHIAEHYLSPDVDSILRTDLCNHSLSNASNWNDDFDHFPDGKWSADLHFAEYPGNACKFDWVTDCKNDRCVTGAIVNYTKQIFDPSISRADRFFALKFVIHMVGDLHQPLHCGSKVNYGGNSIKIPPPHFSNNKSHWLHYGTNLHSVWDGQIVVQEIYDIEDNITLQARPYVAHYHKWRLLAEALERRIGGEWAANKSAWQATVAGSRDESTLRAGLSIVASETAALGCEYAYNYANGSAVQTGDVLDREYYLRGRPIVEEQLAKGGVRLAQLLKEALEQSRVHISETIV